MWPKSFNQRLASWADLKEFSSTADLETALNTIDAWWKKSPWQPYYLHWDDQKDWPDPWQLLSDNVFCGLARGLGILYTIAIIDRPDLQDACLVEVGGDNLVLVHGGKYILNWDGQAELNTSPSTRTQRRLAQSQIKQHYN
jgi:hypothetical protein